MAASPIDTSSRSTRTVGSGRATATRGSPAWCAHSTPALVDIVRAAPNCRPTARDFHDPLHGFCEARARSSPRVVRVNRQAERAAAEPEFAARFSQQAMCDVERWLNPHGGIVDQRVGNSATNNRVERKRARYTAAAADNADNRKTSQQHAEPSLVNFQRCGSNSDVKPGDLIIQETFDIKLTVFVPCRKCVSDAIVTYYIPIGCRTQASISPSVANRKSTRFSISMFSR